jgi:hypothetical protein
MNYQMLLFLGGYRDDSFTATSPNQLCDCGEQVKLQVNNISHAARE